MNLSDFRAQYPQYDDLSDGDLARGLHQRFYADMPFADYAKTIGYEEPSPTSSDYLKSLASGAASGLGAIAQGGGELVSRGVNAIAGTELRAVNPLQGAIDWLEQSKTPAAKQAVADTDISGEVLKPETWDFGKNPTFKGFALQGLNAIGQFAPNLAIALATVGASVPAQVAIGATTGGLQALGGASEEERHKYLAMTPEELSASSTLYQTLIAKGTPPDVARNAVAEAAALGGGLGNALPSAGEGAFENFLVGALTKGRWKIPALFGSGAAGKIATGALGGAALGGTEEAVEQAGQNVGSNLAVGGNRSIGADTLQNFVMGMIAQGAAGGGGGALQHIFKPGERPTITPPAEPVHEPEVLTSGEPFHLETDEQAQARVRRVDPLESIGEATNVDEAIAAANEAVDFQPPDLAQAKAENLALAPLEPAQVPDGIEFTSADPIERAAAVEQAQAAQNVRQLEEAARIPYEPVQPPTAPLALATPAETPVTGIDPTPFLREQALAKAHAVEQAAPPPGAAQSPQFTDYRAPNGEPGTFKSERGAQLFARTNRLTDYTPRDTGAGWALSRPATAFQAATGPLTVEGETNAVQVPGAAPLPIRQAAEGGQGIRSEDAIQHAAAGEGGNGAALAGVPQEQVTAPRFVDYVQPKTIGEGKSQIIKGSIRTFKTERAASLFVKANRLRGYAPRETEDGWVLSKQMRERTESQKVNDQRLRDQATKVLQDDDVLAVLAKSGGMNASAVDGADPKDMALVNKGAFGKPFRATGGLTLDGAAEVLAANGFDALDEAGRPDANKANELIHRALHGEKVYSPEGAMMRQGAAPQEDRRRDAETRLRVADMNPEEMRKALLTDELTGLPNMRAFKEAQPGAILAMADADSLKWLNDTIGYAAGNELLRTIGSAFQRAGVAGFHISGDEFTAYFDSEEQAYEAMGRVKDLLDRATLEFIMPDGSVVTKTGVGLSYGIGPDTATSEIDLHRDKSERQDEGHRAARGEEPPGVRRIPAGEARIAEGPPPGEVAQPAESPKTPAPAGVSLSSVPPGILSKITVPVEQFHEGEGVKTVHVSAEEALADVDREISAYEKLLACVRAA